jgi:tetratricopeptide (TPR) repeat protein
MTTEQQPPQPASAETLTTHSLIHHHMQRYDEALADLTRAIDLNPRYARAIRSRGRVCRLMQRYDEALTDLNRATELDPATPTPWPIAARPTWR